MKPSSRFWLLLYGTPNIVGSLLGLAGVGLLFAGVIDRGWLPITLALYALGWVASWTFMPRAIEGLAATVAREHLEDEMNGLVQQVQARLPGQAAAALQRIRDLVLDLMGRMRAGNPLFVEQAFQIEQTVRNYLPHTLESYLRLPRFYARMHVVKDGKTAELLLLEQMRTLEAGLQRLLENVVADDAQALLANGRFLDAKFRQSESFAA